MIIKTSSMHMSAEHQKTELSMTSSTLDAERFKNGFGFQMQEVLNRNDQSQKDITQPRFGSALLVMNDIAKFRATDDVGRADNKEDLVRARLWQSLMNAIQPDSPPLTNIDDVVAPPSATNPQSRAQPIELKPVTIQMQFKVSETIEEYECTSFSSCGQVTTADGKSIDFDLNLKMERSYAETREYEMTQEVVFTDPLIVNFSGNYADLTDEKYEFDLDADGNTELISYLAGDSGMLALDKNGDGIINDGSELFGALTGNGFVELAEHDEDGNGYIDEADSIYDQLLIWNKGLESESLVSLKDRDIGAIYLGSTETPFDIKGEDNQQNGRVRSSGVYFTEAGEVGTLQQIDMVV